MKCATQVEITISTSTDRNARGESHLSELSIAPSFTGNYVILYRIVGNFLLPLLLPMFEEKREDAK